MGMLLSYHRQAAEAPAEAEPKARTPRKGKAKPAPEVDPEGTESE